MIIKESLPHYPKYKKVKKSGDKPRLPEDSGVGDSDDDTLSIEEVEVSVAPVSPTLSTKSKVIKRAKVRSSSPIFSGTYLPGRELVKKECVLPYVPSSDLKKKQEKGETDSRRELFRIPVNEDLQLVALPRGENEVFYLTLLN